MSRKPFAIRLYPQINGTRNAQKNNNCTHCGQPATKEALFKNSGAIVVEKYCDDCIMNSKKFKHILRMHWRAQRSPLHI